MRRFARAAAVLGACGLLAMGCVEPQRSRVTECIAPASAGGGWDLTCRAVGRTLTALELVRGMVRVTNMPGAGGGVAFVHTVTQRDGDAALVVAASTSTSLYLAQGLYGSLTERDVRWVGALGAEYGVLAVRADAPWRDLGALLSDWRRDPGAVVVGGGSAVAGQDHMKVLLLARAAGMEPGRIRYVPFDGGGEAMSALLGGFVQVMSGDVSEMLAQLEAGNIRLLAVLAPERLSGLLAAVPTAREAGIELDWINWRGLYVPATVADAVYDQWIERLTVLGESEAWAQARRQSQLEPFLLLGEPFERFVYDQVAALRAVSREIGVIP